jgi:hypothetical protein
VSSFLLLFLPFSALLSSFLPSSSMSPADFSASVGTATLVLLPLSPLFDHLASYLLEGSFLSTVVYIYIYKARGRK